MIPRTVIVACIFACLLAGSVFGAITGQISGTVTDSKTGEPLVGVSVAIQGTTMGAKTGAMGKFVINNVPTGDFTLVFSSVGYEKLELTGVHVTADLTTVASQKLTQQVTETGRIVTVTAKIPLVRPDQTTTVQVMQQDQIRSLPIRGFEQAVTLQNSVVRMKLNNDTNVRLRGQRETTATGNELNLRGGRPSEVAYYVDGFSQQDPLTGISSTNISNNAIKEVSVQSGTFSAEYGHVASGIVNVVTNSGTDSYHGTAELVTDNVLGDNYDQNIYSLDLGGPIPGMKKAFFFVSGERRWQGDRSPSVKTEDVFKTFDVDNPDLWISPNLAIKNLNRLPANHMSGWSGQAKLDFELTSAIKLAITGTGSRDDWQEYRHNYLFNYWHSPRYLDKNIGLNAKVTHVINPETYYNLSGTYFMTERIRGDGVLFDDLPAYRRAFANPEWDDMNLFRDPHSPVKASEVDSTVAQGSAGDTVLFYAESYWNNFLHRKSSYLGFKGDFNRQIGFAQTIKAGFDFERHTLRYYENLDPTNTQGFSSDNVNRYGFSVDGKESDSEDYRNNTKHPINLGLYVQDRIDAKGLIIDAGLRFDLFDYKALRIKDPQNPLDPDSATGLNELDRGDLENSKAFTRLSPRLGISFPITDQTQFHINYGQFYQRPDLVRLYVGYDFMAARITQPGSYYPFPSPNLEPEKTTQYEAGIAHQLGENTVLNITAYYKDVQDLTQIFHQTPANPQTYDYFANTDFGTIKGVDLELKVRRSHYVGLDLKYTLSYATGTGSYAQTNYNIAWQDPLHPPKVTSPLDYDQRHNFVALLDYRYGKGEGPKVGDAHPLEKLSANAILQLFSGTPYTPMYLFNAATEAAVNPEPRGRVNSDNISWSFNIDLKIQRQFDVGDFTLVPYIWVQNLLDNKNVVAVYESSGKPDVTGWLQTDEGALFAQNTADQNGAYYYGLKEDNPRNFAGPRVIYFGIRMGF